MAKGRMLMRKRVAVFLAGLLLILGGCAVKGETPASGAAESGEPSSEQAQAVGAIIDGNVDSDSFSGMAPIYFAMPDYLLLSAEKSFAAINEGFAQDKAKYYLQAVGIPTDTEASYYDALVEIIAGGTPVDLVFTGYSASGDPLCPYAKFVQSGLLAPLTPYLEREQGKALKDAYPESVWDSMEYNGAIYLLNFTTTLSETMRLHMSKDLMDKYGIERDTLDRKALVSLTDVFKQIAEGEHNDNLLLLAYTSLAYDDFCPAHAFSGAVALHYSGTEALCVLDDESYIGFLKAVFDLSKMGLVENEYALSNRQSKDVLAVLTDEPHYTDYFYYAYPDANRKQLPLVEVGPMPESYISAADFGTGIYAKSQNKDGAFWMLTQLYTDADCANALAFGAEEEDYTVTKDGKASVRVSEFGLRAGNTLKALPECVDAPKKAEYVDNMLQSAVLMPVVGFRFEAVSVSEQILKTDAIMEELLSTMTTEGLAGYSDFDALLSHYRAKLTAAGVQEIVADCNRQLGTWKVSNK